jgi:probable HAF family extracellular repeat protein
LPAPCTGVSSRIFLSSNGITQDLGIEGSAYDINNKGQVVGSSGTFSGSRAFVSSDDGMLQDLNNLIPPVLALP